MSLFKQATVLIDGKPRHIVSVYDPDRSCAGCIANHDATADGPETDKWAEVCREVLPPCSQNNADHTVVWVDATTETLAQAARDRLQFS
jgi:hypothetical protein